MRDFSLSFQDFSLMGNYLIVESIYPVLHFHRLFFKSLEFREIQKFGNQKIQSLQFNFRKIIFRDFHIVFCNIIAFEICHSDIRLFAVNTLINKFCRRMLVNRIVKFVLNSRKKVQRHFRARVVVSRGCINIRNLLVKIPLA